MTQPSIWHYEPTKQLLEHQSGLCLQLEGPVSEPNGIVPINIPEGMNPLQLAKLIREGMEFCREMPTPSTSSPVKPAAKRPVLTLKRSKIAS